MSLWNEKFCLPAKIAMGYVKTTHLHLSKLQNKLLTRLQEQIEFNNRMHPKYYAITQSIYQNDPMMKPDHIQTIESRFGSGSIVLMFESVSALQRGQCFIPQWLRPIPSSCLINESKKIFYAPYNVLDIIGLEKLEERSFGRLCSIQILIYYDHQISNVFRSYHGICFYPDELHGLLIEKRLSVSLLRNKYTDFMPLFCEKKKHHVMSALKSFFKLQAGCSLYQLVSCLLMPKTFTDFIEDKLERECIRELIDNMHKQSKIVEHFNISILYSGFVKETMFEIERIVGSRLLFGFFRKLAQYKQMENVKREISMVIQKLNKRICGFCKIKEIHYQTANITRKYKICAKCKTTFYCSRSCQKKHWNKIHRYDCTEMV
eukprot:366_1